MAEAIKKEEENLYTQSKQNRYIIMKALKKGKKYNRVQPLPNGWLGPNAISNGAATVNVYQKSFRELKLLLDEGWKFCGKEKMRLATTKLKDNA